MGIVFYLESESPVLPPAADTIVAVNKESLFSLNSYGPNDGSMAKPVIGNLIYTDSSRNITAFGFAEITPVDFATTWKAMVGEVDSTAGFCPVDPTVVSNATQLSIALGKLELIKGFFFIQKSFFDFFSQVHLPTLRLRA